MEQPYEGGSGTKNIEKKKKITKTNKANQKLAQKAMKNPTQHGQKFEDGIPPVEKAKHTKKPRQTRA